ncbi:uncharacterized protein CXorf49 homolog isoform 2-T3 [Thomomys bottae]
MDSWHDMFRQGPSLGARGGKRYSLHRARQGGPRAPGFASDLGHRFVGDLGPPQIVRDLLGPQGNNIGSELNLEPILSGVAGFQGGSGDVRPFTEERGDAWYSMLNFNMEDHSPYQVPEGQLGILKRESYTANLSANWVETAPGLRGRNMLVFSHVESQQASATIENTSRPKFYRAWEEKKAARETSRMVTQKAQWPSSDNETSEECHRKQDKSLWKKLPDRLSYRGHAEPDSSKGSEGTTENSDDQNEDIFYSMPGSLLPFSAQELMTIKENQRWLEETSCKIKQSVIKKYPEAAAAAGGMPRGCCTKKMAEEKKLTEGPSRVILGRNTPSCKQMTKILPLEAAALSPILVIPHSEGSNATTTLHPGPKRYKQGNNMKRYGGWRRRKSFQVAKEHDEANRDPGVQDQLPKYRSGPFYRQFRRSDHYTRNSPVQMNVQNFPKKQRNFTPKGRATSGKLGSC